MLKIRNKRNILSTLTYDSIKLMGVASGDATLLAGLLGFSAPEYREPVNNTGGLRLYCKAFNKPDSY